MKLLWKLVTTSVVAMVFIPGKTDSNQAGIEQKALPALPELLRVENDTIPNIIPVFAFSADSKLFAYAQWEWPKATSPEVGRICIFDVVKGKQIHRFAKNADIHFPTQALFSPASDKLFAGHVNDNARIWNLTRGDFLIIQGAQGNEQRYYGTPFCFTPDGKEVYANMGDSIQFWDATTGKKTHQLDAAKSHSIATFFLSNDGKIAVAEESSEINSEPVDSHRHRVTIRSSGRIWDVGTGKTLGTIGRPVEAQWLVGRGPAQAVGKHDANGPLQQVGATSSGFRYRMSPAGRTMFFTIIGHDQILDVTRTTEKDPLQIRDKANQKELYRTADYIVRDPHIQLSPDHKMLVAYKRSGAFVLLDVSRFRDEALQSRKPLTATEISGLWDKLAAEDPHQAWQAAQRMRNYPEQALQLLKKRVSAVPDQSKKVTDLILQLDDKQFKIRQQAEWQLKQMIDDAGAQVKKAVAKPTSEETRQRLKNILDTAQGLAGPETRRLLWTIEFLELNASPHAIELLERLATGGPEAWVTQEAIISLERLGKKPKK